MCKMYNVVIFKINYGAESYLPARGDLLYRVMAVELQQSVGEGAPLTVQLQVERMGGGYT